MSRVTTSLAQLDRKIHALRGRLGAQWSLVALLMPPALFGIIHFGARAALVLAVTVLACMACGIAGRILKGEPYQWVHPGSLISGLLIGLTCSADTPLYMLLVGAAVAELLGKGVLPGTHNPFNPAVLGRSSIGLLEYFFRPLPETDAISSASVLFKEAGGHLRPDLWNAFWGLTPGAIGETSHFILLLVGVVLLRYVVVKWEAAVALLLTVPIVVLVLPPTPEIMGHAPWVHNPLYYLLGGSTLFTALFFATDPKTIPNTRLGCVLFGAGVGVIGVLGKYYTDVPGFEMYGILVMNLLSPWLGRVTVKQATPKSRPAASDYGVSSFYATAPSQIYDKKLLPLHGHTPRLNRYAQVGRYAFLEQYLFSGKRDVLLAAVQRSCLSGCGGGNMPVSTKWAALRRTAGPRYLVVNALEGEPETFKDRYLLINHATTVVEGVSLAAWALEVNEAIIVINAGYTECFAPVQAAVGEVQSRFGNMLRCKLVVMAGPDPELYIAGEETALIAYLEGRRAEPRDRPPHPSQCGLWGRPTLVHNVETLAWIPVVLGSGDHLEAQSQPRLISLSGAVAHPGVYEAVLGEKVAEVIARGGGLMMNEQLQALCIGGVSGGLLPPACMEMRFTPEALQQAGAMLGSGAIRVLSSHDNLLHETAKAMHFFREQSCGLCTPCRAGTQNLARFADRLSNHTLSDDDYERFRDMADAMSSTSICGLGRRAPAPLQSLLRYWGKDEVVIKRLTGTQDD